MSNFSLEVSCPPLLFPDAYDEAHARAAEFSQLPADTRWQEIAAMMEWGLTMARSSPRRSAIEERWQAQEDEWRRIQQQLMVQHGQ